MSEVDLGWGALAGLTAISIACTAAALFVFRRFSDRRAVARVKNLSQAHLLEIRLFADEPREVLRSERALLLDQLHLVALLARPLLILALPMMFAIAELEGVYGRVPLRPGEAAVVTVKSSAREISLAAPAGIAVETPPVRGLHDGEVSWRIRPLRPASGTLEVREDSRVVTAPVAAGWGLNWKFANPFSHPLAISYPAATVMGLPWLVWFLGIALIAGMVWR